MNKVGIGAVVAGFDGVFIGNNAGIRFFEKYLVSTTPSAMVAVAPLLNGVFDGPKTASTP